MTDFEQRAKLIPSRDSEFLWALIIDMAKTIDLLLAQSQPDKTEVN